MEVGGDNRTDRGMERRSLGGCARCDSAGMLVDSVEAQEFIVGGETGRSDPDYVKYLAALI